MFEPTALLATLAQSSAAIVAIVGGFLVSRLVALSSEREAVRRQLVSVRDRLKHVREEYDGAHEYRLSNSQSDYFDWVIGDLVKLGVAEIDYDQFMEEHSVPRGSDEEEMRPYLVEVHGRVRSAFEAVRPFITTADSPSLDLDALKRRTLTAPKGEQEVYEHVVDYIAEHLPAPRGPYGMASFPTFTRIHDVGQRRH